MTGYELSPAELEATLEYELLDRLREIAVRSRIAVLAGLPQAVDGGIVNAAAMSDAAGSVRAVHHKAHLFGDLDRSLFLSGSSAVTVTELNGVRIAILICYDAEFPETVREAALADAHLVAVPTAQMEPFEFVADHLVRTRAWENQIYVAYANHVGVERELTYVGRSSIVAPSGQVLVRADGDDVVVADVSVDRVTAGRAANPYLDDRRPDLYLEGARDDS